jgi:hypothetical protein
MTFCQLTIFGMICYELVNYTFNIKNEKKQCCVEHSICKEHIFTQGYKTKTGFQIKSQFYNIEVLSHRSHNYDIRPSVPAYTSLRFRLRADSDTSCMLIFTSFASFNSNDKSKKN